VPEGFNAFIYMLQGKLRVGRIIVGEHEGALLEPGSLFDSKTDSPSRFVLVAGKPHNEEVVFRGSFVD
jgi:redox-sensitive bicupin YhaK (pirin superfamily)